MAVKIFFCYAREDEPHLKEIQKHLKPLQRQGLIDTWYDRNISPGAEWEKEVNTHLHNAQIILLLVSADFMDSDYCYDIEMQQSLERHKRGEARVIPIIVRPIHWQETLGQLQALPTDGKPVIDPTWHNMEMAYNNIAEGVRNVVTDWADRSHAIVQEEQVSDGKTKDAELPLVSELEDLPPVATMSFAEKAIIAIREGQPDMPARVRDYMMDLAAKIPLIPPTNAQDVLDEQLVQAINASTALGVEFAQIVTIIAERNVVEAAQTVYERFADILNLYTFPPGPRPEGETFTRDLAKFLGYELFIIFVALLIQNKRWELLATLLDEDLYARTSDYGQPEFVPFVALCQPVASLVHRTKRLALNTRSLQGNMLYDRHATGKLAIVVPAEQFMEADYFLFLRDLLKPATAPQWPDWRAWSTVPMKKPASFLQRAVRGEVAGQLARALGLPDVPTLQARLTERQHALTNMWTYGFQRPWFDPLERFDIDSIGSRP